MNPPLKNPGYAHEECIFIYFIYIIYLFIYYNLWDEMQKSQRPHTKADPSPPKFKVVVLKPKPWVDFHIRDQNGGRQKNHCYSDQPCLLRIVMFALFFVYLFYQFKHSIGQFKHSIRRFKHSLREFKHSIRQFRLLIRKCKHSIRQLKQ